MGLRRLGIFKAAVTMVWLQTDGDDSAERG